MSRSAANADIFQAIADPTRRCSISSGREQPDQLAQPFDMFLPAISQHLQVLCDVIGQSSTSGTATALFIFKS